MVTSDTGPLSVIPMWVVRKATRPAAIRVWCELEMVIHDGAPSLDYLRRRCHPCSEQEFKDAYEELVAIGAVDPDTLSPIRVQR
jgi:hypothetical protein